MRITDSFSIIHALAYSFIGFQTAYAATHWNPIYWNTACLIVNSGALDESEEFFEYDEEYVLRRRERTTDYSKVAKALGEIISRNIKVSLVDINHSSYTFKPNVENNEILFGMKALNRVGSEVIDAIIKNRPYYNFKAFMKRCPLNKTVMISLIKAGAFDKLELEWAKELHIEPRYLIMIYYLSVVSEPKNKLNLQNFNGLMTRNLIPESLDFEKKIYNFNKYLKTRKYGAYYKFDSICEMFYSKFFDIELLEIINGITCIKQTIWDKIYSNRMDKVRAWLKENQQQVLAEYNYLLFMDCWDKYALGTLSSWEMESLCFYYHEHELSHVDMNKYGIIDFFKLNPESEIDYFFKKNNAQIPIYKLYKIIGTVISKNDTKSSVTLLTTTGVVTVKFAKDYYAMYNRQLSQTQADGTKKILERGWFTRGNKIMVTGFRRDDMFIGKTYAKTPTHQLYKITEVSPDGDMKLIHERTDIGE